MSLTKLTKDLSIISKLSDEPNDIDGLTADELKAKFDESGNSIKDYLNNTLISELDAAIEDIDSDIEAIGEAVQESYKKPDGGIPKTDLASDVQTSLGKADTALQAGALPAGGTDGDVLVKSGATDYSATWSGNIKTSLSRLNKIGVTLWTGDFTGAGNLTIPGISQYRLIVIYQDAHDSYPLIGTRRRGGLVFGRYGAAAFDMIAYRFGWQSADGISISSEDQGVIYIDPNTGIAESTYSGGSNCHIMKVVGLIPI